MPQAHINQGIGVLSPIIVPAVYALVKIFEPARQGLPAPPTRAYVVATFLAHNVILALALAVAFTPVTNEHWSNLNLAFQLSPLVLFPLALFPIARPTASEIPEATKLFAYLRPAFALGWWATIALGIYGYVLQGERDNPAAHILMWDNIGVLTAFVGLWLVDAANGDAKWSNPLHLLQRTALLGPPAAMCDYFESKESQNVCF